MFFEFFPNLSLFLLLCEAVSCDCFQTSMPLKWNCGSTVFALDTQLVKPFRLLSCSPLPCMKVFSQNLFLCHNISPWCPVRASNPTGPSLEYGFYKFHSQFLACLFFPSSSSSSQFDFPFYFYSQLAFMTWNTKNTAWPICEKNLLRLLLMGCFIFWWVVLCCLWCSTLHLGQLLATLCNFPPLTWYKYFQHYFPEFTNCSHWQSAGLWIERCN